VRAFNFAEFDNVSILLETTIMNDPMKMVLWTIVLVLLGLEVYRMLKTPKTTPAPENSIPRFLLIVFLIIELVFCVLSAVIWFL